METNLLNTQEIINISINEWQKIDFNSEFNLKGFHFSKPESTQLIAQLSNNGFIDLLELPFGLKINTFQYVGKIEIENLRISIKPKIAELPLLNLLRYTYKLKEFKLYDPLTFGTENNNFFDLLIYQLILEVNELIHRGLLRSYTKSFEQLQSPRGKIEFTKIAKKGGIIEPYLPCSNFKRIENNYLNQSLLAGLNFSIQMTDDIELKSLLRKTSKILSQNVSEVQLSKKIISLAQTSINRLTLTYQPALTLIERLFNSLGLSLDQNDEQIKLPGFLFDMNLFFQELIGKFLREYLTNYQIQEQFRLKKMLSYNANHNPQLKKFASPRPDFAVMNGKKVVILLDTKYRDIWEKDLPSEMLYQLCFYAISQGISGEASIIYPTLNVSANEEWIDVSHPISQKLLATVKLRPVNLNYLENLIFQKLDKQKQEYAHYIAFGN